MAEDRWKLECDLFFAPDDSNKPRPPIKLPKPITMHQGRSTSASASAAAAASAASSCRGLEDAAFAAAPSSLPSLSAADRVECMLSGLGAAVLSGDLALVLRPARQYSVMERRVAELEAALVLQQQASVQPAAAFESGREQQLQQRIAELEAAHSDLLARFQLHADSMETRLHGVKREKLDTEESLVKTTQLKRTGHRELDSERKKLRATEHQMEQREADLASHHAHLTAVVAQLTEQRAVVVGLEHEHAELLTLLQAREDSAAGRLSVVKLEKAEATEALEQTTQLKRKAEDERDEAHKRAKTAEEELEHKVEQLEQLNCISCEEARVTVAYLPCFHVLLCEACDRKWQGGPDRAAAAGSRTCPSCRGAIASTGKAHVGH